MDNILLNALPSADQLSHVTQAAYVISFAAYLFVALITFVSAAFATICLIDHKNDDSLQTPARRRLCLLFAMAAAIVCAVASFHAASDLRASRQTIDSHSNNPSAIQNQDQNQSMPLKPVEHRLKLR